MPTTGPRGFYGLTDRPYLNCDACGRGKHGNDILGGLNISICLDCIAGKYSTTDGLSNAALCADCVSGRYNSQPGKTEKSDCIMCGIGKYGLTIGSKNGTADCISCNEGTFSDITGVQSVNDCKECPAGYQNQQTGSPACNPCQAGKFRKLKKNYGNCNSQKSFFVSLYVALLIPFFYISFFLYENLYSLPLDTKFCRKQIQPKILFALPSR